MTKYEVYNRDSGHFYGVYEAENEQGAIDAMARDAGYSDYASIPDELAPRVKAVPPPRYLLEPCEAGDISALDLQDEIAKAKADDMEIETYRITKMRDDGFRDSVTGSMLWLPDIGRGGIAYGSDAAWTDAEDADHALALWVDGDMRP